MSKNIDQIFISNPASSMDNTDLLYLGRAPYDDSGDMAITWADMKTSIDVPPLPLSLANGGTQADLTASPGGIFYSTPTTGAILDGTATSNQLLLSGSNSAPHWSTVIFPDSIGVNEMLYTSTDNFISGIAPLDNSILIGDPGGVPTFDNILPLAVQENIGAVGTVNLGTWHANIISSQYGGTSVNNAGKNFTMTGNVTFGGAIGANFTANLTANTNVTFPTSGTLATTSQLPTLPVSPANGGTGVNNGSNTIAIAGSIAFSGSHTFSTLLTGDTNVTFPTSGTLATTSQTPVVIDQTTGSVFLQALPFISYITDYPSGLVTYLLPNTAPIGTIIKIVGKSSGGWIISQNAGQQLLFGALASTVGVTGHLLSTSPTDCVELSNTTADTVWTVTTYIGTLSVI